MLNYFLRIYKNMPIKQKLLLLFSIQIIIPLIFMGVMLYRNTERIIQKNTIISSIEKLKSIELRIDDFTRNIVDITGDLIYDEKVHHVLNEDKEIQKDLEYYESNTYVNKFLRKICLAKKEIYSIALISKNEIYYSYDQNSGRASLEDEIPYEKILKAARTARQKPVWFLDTGLQGNIQNLYLVRMIYDIDNFNEVGIVVLCINREFLKESYSGVSAEYMEHINISSMDNTWIVGTAPYSKSTLSKQFDLEELKQYDYVIDKENNILLAYMKVNNGEWIVITESSLSKMNEELDKFRVLFIIITICTILILSVFSILMAIDIIDPINRLVEGIKKVQAENVHQEVLVDRNDELGYLSKCFNKMSKEIDILVNRVYKEQLTRKEAELKALQAQINPHFLYNTLESINWMAQLNNVPDIRDMVTSLGSIMEASIGNGNPLVPLRQELKYIDSYILIMKNRYGDRLTYESDIDEMLLGSRVPKLLLQPLVENAIYHGIDRMRKKGEIKVTIKSSNEGIYIEVMDNGKGIEEEELLLLNNKFKQSNDEYLLHKHRKGIGLENVNGRIKLFFGQEYGLRMESEYEKYTKVILAIPINY